MKVKLMKSVVAGAFVALAGAASAYDDAYNDGTYTWGVNYLSGSSAEVLVVIPRPTTGDVDVPEKVGGRNVTRIGNYLFTGCTGLLGAGLPKTLTEIGEGAFSGCSSLMDIIMWDSLAKIGKQAFSGCSAFTHVEIPESVTQLGEQAFGFCSKLKRAALPYQFTKTSSELLNSYFYGCPADLNFVFSYEVSPTVYMSFRVLGNSVEIGDVDLSNTKARAIDSSVSVRLAIPGTLGGFPVRSIADYAFSDCHIESVTVSDGVTSIGTGAFANCANLQSVQLPATVKSLGQGAFANCTSLLGARLPIGFAGKDISSYFSGCPAKMFVAYVAKMSGKEYTIGEIEGKQATLLSVTPRPEGKLSISKVSGYKVKTLAMQVFKNCAGLTQVALSSAVEEIGEEAFRYCTSLESVRILPSVTYIGKNAFANCPALKTVYVKTGETGRVKALLEASGFNTTGVTFVETGDDVPEYDVDPASIDPFNPGELPCYTVLDPASIWDPIKVTKATSLFGAVYYGCDIVGVVELKIGKPKKSETKLSGSVTLNTGKKYTIKSQKFNFGGQYAGTPNLTVNKLGSLRIALGSIDGRNVFSGSLGSYHVQTASVGGNWTRTDASATVSVGDLSVIPGMVVTDLLPSSEPVTPSRGKWAFKKAASVKWTKVKAGVTPLILQPATGKGLVVDTSKGKTNLSALKLTYTPKSGIFKGSFKVYALQGSGSATKLKKYTVKVTGFVVDGAGVGKATCKTPAINWSVTVD